MAFDRDLGYLDKFFDNLEAHAGTLGDVQGSRLKQLLGEERQRWGEIRSLLGGLSSAGEKAGGEKAGGEKAGGEKAGGEKKGASEQKAAPASASREEERAAPKGSEAPSSPPALTAGAPSGAKGDVTATATRVPVSGFTVGSLRGR